MSNHEWRWADPAGQQRLVRTDELRAALSSGLIPANAPVWRRGWTEWKPAQEVPELSQSALGAANGVLLNVPPPPLFVVAAQSEFEGEGGDDAAEEEPPPPPRYVPLAAPAPPAVPPVVTDAKPKVAEAPKAAEKPKTPEASPKPAIVVPKPAEATTKPMPVRAKDPPKIPPAPMPIKPAAKTVQTAPAATAKAPAVAHAPAPAPAARAGLPPSPPPGSEMRSIPTMRGIPVIPDPTKVPKIEMPHVEKTAPMPRVEPVPHDAPSSIKRATLPVFPAPPPMTKADEPSARPPPEPAPVVVPPPADSPQPALSKHPTLIQFGGAPESTPPPVEAAPIVVPPPEKSEVTGGSVTRPPPWGEGAVGMAPDIPKSTPAPKIAPENVEELSGSMLLPESIPPPLPANRPVELSSSDLTSEAEIVVAKPAPLVPGEKRAGTLMGMAPPPLTKSEKPPKREEEPLPAKTEPMKAPPKMEEDAVPLPRPSGARTINLREIARERPPWFLASAGAFGALLFIGLVGVVMKIAGSGSGATTATSASATAATSVAPTVSTTPTAVTTTTAPSTPKSVTCAVSGKPKTIASSAMVGSGVEVRASGGGVALAFATSPKDGTLMVLDPSTLDATSTSRAKSADAIRRVVALKSGVALDSDRKGDKLQGRRTVVTNPPIDLGSDGTNLAWAAHGTDKTIPLWPLGGTGPVEAIRAEQTDAATFVAFRQGTSIYVGAFGGTPPAPLGGLTKIDGFGPKVGSPAIAASGDHALVVWADRAADTDPWGLRYVAFQAGKDAPAAKKFDVPAGGLGEHAMSPGVASLAGGHYFLLWAEGPTSSHQVRGIVLDSAGAAHGDALTVSAEGVNAGQGQAAVQADGKGVVAFLAGSGKSFDVIATSIACTEK